MVVDVDVFEFLRLVEIRPYDNAEFQHDRIYGRKIRHLLVTCPNTGIAILNKVFFLIVA